MIKQIFSAVKIATIAFALSFGISYVYAWVAPTVTPPGGNATAPINTSATAQTKSGNLTVGSIIAPQHCIGTSCVTSWPSGGSTPPAGSSFLDTSTTAQTKSGGLTAGALTATGNVQGQHIKFPGVGGDSGAGADYYGIYQESGPWSYPYPDLRIQYHTGIKYDAHQSYGGHQFYTGYDGSGNPAGLQMQITDKVYVSTDVCTTAGKCLSAATTGASGGTFKTAQDYINAYSGKTATIPAKLVAANTAWVNLLAYTFDNIYTSGSYYCYTLNGSSGCQSYAADQTIKFGSDGYIYVDSVPALNNEYGYWGLYEVVPANRVNNIRLCYYATPSLNTTGNGSCSIVATAPRYASGYKLAIGGWLGATTAINISYSLNGVTVSGGSYPATTVLFP